MGRLDLNITDELEKRFRAAVYHKKGMKKGNLTDAVEEALEDLILKYSEDEEEEK